MTKRCSTQNASYRYRILTGLPSRKSKTLAIVEYVKGWKNALNKYTENYVSKIFTVMQHINICY
jgi:hypothetical protein